MKLIANLLVVAALMGFPLASATYAGDLGSATSKGVPLAAKVDQDINQATSGEANTPSGDIDSRIKDLDATRTAIDQKRPPTVSLSVSGWVSQEVQYNAKQ